MLNKMVFLGGTCGNNNWRDGFTEKLIAGGVSKESIFNPVVKDWNAKAQEAEELAKKEASYLLFYIANPKLEGISVSAYSLVEATMALYDKAAQTVVVFDFEGIEGHSLKSVKQSMNVLRVRFPSADIFGTIDEAADYLVSEFK